MRRHVLTIGLGLLLLSGAGPAWGGYQIHWIMHPSAADSGRSRETFQRALQVQQAQAAFSSAYAVAQRSLPLNSEIDQARETLRSTHRAYQTVVQETKQTLENRPDIKEQIVRIRQLERELAAAKDPQVHYELASTLMRMRSELSKAEWEVLSSDPDITVAKAEYMQAAQKLAGLQQRQVALVLEDEQVAAAKQRLDQLRHQLAYGG